ncbi:putative Receptor protein kinase [Melia azedarach]|uniref:Receptor protein kinase n=1 Tax=Melia azedarach TaxID=155640 RepID=A0ACC1Y3X6_MELAZ|nr:putative Receptor protein kinase [Melia azedarach]
MATRGRNQILSSFSFCLICQLSFSQTDKLLQGQVLKDGDELVSAFGNFRLGFFSPDGTTDRYLGIWYHIPTDRRRLFHLEYMYYTYTTSRRDWVDYNQFVSDYNNYSKEKRLVQDFIEFSSVSRPVWVANRNFPILSNESASLTVDSTDGNLKILRNGGDPIEITSVRGTGNTRATLLKNGNFVLCEMNSDGSTGKQLWQSFDYPTDTLLPGMKLGINLKTGQKWFLQSWSIESKSPVEGSYILGMDPNITNKLIIWKGGEVNWTSEVLGEKSYVSYATGPSLYNFSFTSNEEERYVNYSVHEDVSFPILTIGTSGGLTDDTGRNVLCSGFGGCQDYMIYPDDDEMGRKFSWVSVIRTIVTALGPCLWVYVGYKMQRIFDRDEEKKHWVTLTFVFGVVLVVPLLVFMCFTLVKKLKAKAECMVNRQKLLRELGDNVSLSTIFGNGKTQAKDQTMNNELKIFDFQTIAAATSNFSTVNRLGQGGFGPVYKGKLLDGQRVAIKRLSKCSGQGIVEFKNEAKLIAKFQHTNLVRLLGCSLQGGERLLVYEYLPNKSLDFFIFDSRRKKLLNWMERFKIIEGIAQGLLYLHKYSRLTVIHRDLKASNILLDNQMNPKISDFGMAKTFAINELETTTKRIVGTRGYMSPEYIMKGIISFKSDVYSFGVLVLEILSNKKNNSCFHTDRSLNLVGYAWQLWNEGKCLELIDPILGDESFSPDEFLRCIHVGLLCVQHNATDRPTMSEVVSLLSNETMALPPPKQPAFFINIASDQVPEVTEIKLEACSVNDVTISKMDAR